jgi:hypothetical protein
MRLLANGYEASDGHDNEDIAIEGVVADEIAGSGDEPVMMI